MSAKATNPERDPRIEACGTASAHPQDLAKVEIFAFLSQLAEVGQASLSPLENGEIEVRFITGEIFLLGASTITRLD
jgi:hypothetical protein